MRRGLSQQTVVAVRTEVDQAGAPSMELRAYAVRQSGRSPFPNFISIGRTTNNDVVINDESLSKFHAYIRRDPSGAFWINDAGSRNGTRIDGAPAPNRDEGRAAQLTPGADVELGSLRFVFLNADQLRKLVLRTIAGQRSRPRAK